MKQTSLKKIRKKQEACFGKDLQVIRNSFFKPNIYKHFKTSINSYQKIVLICKSSKFKTLRFLYKDRISTPRENYFLFL